MTDQLDVVICTWAGEDRDVALATLRATAAQAPVVLVDMCPDERIVAGAREIDGVKVHHVPGSSGLGESRQRGLEASERRLVAFLDADAVPRRGWRDALLAAVAPDDVAVAGGPVLAVWPERRPPALFRTQAAGDFLSMLDLGPEQLDVPRVLPGNMVVDRELTGADVFAADLGRREGELLGAEEIQMMVRVVAEGRRIVYTPGAAVDHRTTSDRMRWRWMWRRVEAAGRESALTEHRLEPIPRPVSAGDRLFQAAVAPAFVLGRWRARRRQPKP